MDKSVQGILGISMDKIRELTDVNTVIGEPISTPDGITLIPVSKVSYGFASGGSDLPTKTADKFGGGTGAGVSITPIAFLAIKNGDVQILQLVSKPDSGDRVINMVPDLVDKVSALFKRGKKSDTDKSADPSDAD